MYERIAFHEFVLRFMRDSFTALRLLAVIPHGVSQHHEMPIYIVNEQHEHFTTSINYAGNGKPENFEHLTL